MPPATVYGLFQPLCLFFPFICIPLYFSDFLSIFKCIEGTKTHGSRRLVQSSGEIRHKKNHLRKNKRIS